MTAITLPSPNVMKKDSDGNWYAIPEKEVDAFIQASEAVELSEFMSYDWMCAVDELNNSFGAYRKYI